MYLKTDFRINNDNVDSRAMNRIKQYLESFKHQTANKQKDALNFDIGRRISEEYIVDEISTVYYQTTGHQLIVMKLILFLMQI